MEVRKGRAAVIRRVVVTRADYLFGRQCVPGGATVDAGGAAGPRYQGATLPPCVAVAIAAESEVRAVRLSKPGQAFDGMVNLIEGAPQLFPFAGGAVDLARYDWHDGRLVLECAETAADIAGLSVFVAPFAQLNIDAYDSVAVALVAYMAPPRIFTGSMVLGGSAIRVGGVDTVITRVSNALAADGLSTLAPAIATSSLSTAVVTAAVQAQSSQGHGAAAAARAVAKLGYAIGGGVLTAQFFIRGA